MSERTHRIGIIVFIILMLAHWAEHIVQMFQVYGMHCARANSLGLLGIWFPSIVRNESLHFFYAVLTFLGLAILFNGFQNNRRALTAWTIATVISIWHLFEHCLLYVQAQSGHYLFGRSEPVSILQLFFPRVELHMFYNTIVTIPILAALYYQGKAKYTRVGF